MFWFTNCLKKDKFPKTMFYQNHKIQDDFFMNILDVPLK